KIKIKERSYLTMLFLMVLGLVGLYFGGKWTVDGAVYIAQQFGLSNFLISATIVAIGTSLPELVTSVTAALKKDVDMAVGNVVGSNIFNIFWILGITAIFAPLSVPSFINTDLIILVLATLALFAFMFLGKKHHLTRWEGIAFVLAYIAYIIFLIIRG
ncbi:MAG: sodium:calcium antiporter, partial [Nanoarchaeota archaeon]